MRTIKYIFIWTIIIGVMGYALNTIWPNTITFLATKTTNPMPNFQVNIKTFNFQNWLQNISIAASKTTELTLKMPTRTWTSDANLFNIFDMLVNNLALILDYGILAINIVMFPFRIIAYIVELLLAFIGFNINNTEGNAFKWLMELLSWFINRLEIPYV